MLVAEQMDKLKMHNPVKIFATDISRDSLTNATRGHYSQTGIVGLSETRLQQFFIKESTGFRVKSRLRERVVFANHNLLSDPPFTKLSLIGCRNLPSSPAVMCAVARCSAVEGSAGRRTRVEFEAPQSESNLPQVTLGSNYFEACVRPDAGPAAAACVDGMRKVLRGELAHFLHDYSSSTQSAERWFRIHVVPVHSPEMGLAIAHFNITPTRRNQYPPSRLRTGLPLAP